jgi:nitrate reductase NapAB chaperone NapD
VRLRKRRAKTRIDGLHKKICRKEKGQAVMTSGLVVCLADDVSEADGVIRALQSCPLLTLGDQNGRWVTAALQTEDAETSDFWYRWVRDLTGVIDVEVVFVHWDDAKGDSPNESQ